MKNFEQEAKNRLNHYDSPVDTDRLWAGIDDSLRGKKRRRIAGWWWWAGACLLVGTALVAYYSNTNTDAGQHTTDPAVTPQAPSAQNNPAAIAHTGENPNTSSAVYIPDLANTAPISNHPSKAPTPANRHGVDEKEKVFSPVNQALPKQQVSGASATGVMTDVGAPISIEQQNTEVSSPLFKKETNIALLPGTSPLSIKIISGNAPQLNTQKVECFSWKTKPRWHIGAYGTGGYPLKKLTAQNDEFADLTADRNQTEKVLEAAGGGFYAGIRFKNKWLVESGVDFLRINERFTRTNTRVDTIGKTLIISYIVNAPGDTTFTQGESYIVQTTKASRKTYNHYNTLNLPVALGYEWAMGQHFSANLKAGAAVNLHFSQKAEIATGNQQSILYQNGQPATDYPFRARLGVIPFAEFGMRWSFADRLSLCGAVHYRYFVQPFNIATNPVEQRYQLAGARIGLQYQL